MDTHPSKWTNIYGNLLVPSWRRHADPFKGHLTDRNGIKRLADFARKEDGADEGTPGKYWWGSQSGPGFTPNRQGAQIGKSREITLLETYVDEVENGNSARNEWSERCRKGWPAWKQAALYVQDWARRRHGYELGIRVHLSKWNLFFRKCPSPATPEVPLPVDPPVDVDDPPVESEEGVEHHSSKKRNFHALNDGEQRHTSNAETTEQRTEKRTKQSDLMSDFAILMKHKNDLTEDQFNTMLNAIAKN